MQTIKKYLIAKIDLIACFAVCAAMIFCGLYLGRYLFAAPALPTTAASDVAILSEATDFTKMLGRMIAEGQHELRYDDYRMFVSTALEACDKGNGDSLPSAHYCAHAHQVAPSVLPERFFEGKGKVDMLPEAYRALAIMFAVILGTSPFAFRFATQRKR